MTWHQHETFNPSVVNEFGSVVVQMWGLNKQLWSGFPPAIFDFCGEVTKSYGLKLASRKLDECLAEMIWNDQITFFDA
jgi:hypothetical protein